MNNHMNEKGWVEYLRFITPILVTISIFMLANINAKVDDIGEKLFKHLTNDEMHSPRSVTVSKAEFDVYQDLVSQQILLVREDMNSRISNLTKSIDKAIDALNDKNAKTR